MNALKIRKYGSLRNVNGDVWFRGWDIEVLSPVNVGGDIILGYSFDTWRTTKTLGPFEFSDDGSPIKHIVIVDCDFTQRQPEPVFFIDHTVPEVSIEDSSFKTICSEK